jgi:hypothetical protein
MWARRWTSPGAATIRRRPGGRAANATAAACVPRALTQSGSLTRRCNRYANLPFSLLQPLQHFYLHQHAEFKWPAPSLLTVVQSYKAVHATRIPLNPLCIPISHHFPALHSLACTSPLFFCIGSPSSLALGRPTFSQSDFWVTFPDILGWHLDTEF